MLDLIVGYWISQMVLVMAKLGIADHLKSAPRGVEEIAGKVGADPGALRRVMRALASVGVLAEGQEGRFGLPPLGATLRSARPDSMLSFALMAPDGYNWKTWEALQYCVKTGSLRSSTSMA